MSEKLVFDLSRDFVMVDWLADAKELMGVGGCRCLVAQPGGVTFGNAPASGLWVGGVA